LFSTVIVGFDGSERGYDALALARTLCNPQGGTLLLACAYPYEPLFDEELAMGERSRAARLEAEELLAAARADLRDVPVECCALPCTAVARALTEFAEDEGADLVVIGSTHRAHRRVGLGNVALRLLHGSPCAVAVAPPDYHAPSGLRRVGIAYDGSPEAETALDAGYRIAEDLHAGVTIYSAHEANADRARDRVAMAALHAPGILVPETRVLEGPPAEVISQAISGVIDLLVMGSRGYRPIRRALLGSVSEGLVRAATVPVLVMPRSAIRDALRGHDVGLAGSAT
jgi:nucleotide-binding universal stress UspA family protein